MVRVVGVTALVLALLVGFTPGLMSLKGRRFSWRRVAVFLGFSLMLLATGFFYNLWELRQYGGACTVSPKLVSLYAELHLYNVTYFCA